MKDSTCANEAQEANPLGCNTTDNNHSDEYRAFIEKLLLLRIND